MVANCNEPECPTAPGVSPDSLDLLYIFLKPKSFYIFLKHVFVFLCIFLNLCEKIILNVTKCE